MGDYLYVAFGGVLHKVGYFLFGVVASIVGLFAGAGRLGTAPRGVGTVDTEGGNIVQLGVFG